MTKRLINPRVLPLAAALFARIVGIERENDDQTWETLGGRRREYLDLGVKLQELLGLEIHDVPPHYTLEVMPADEPDPESWQHALALQSSLRTGCDGARRRQIFLETKRAAIEIKRVRHAVLYLENKSPAKEPTQELIIFRPEMSPSSDSRN